MTAANGERRRSPSTRKKLLLAVPIALVSLEVFARLFSWGAGETYDVERTVRRIEESIGFMAPNPRRIDQPTDASGVASTRIAHPYTGWDHEHLLEILEQDIDAFDLEVDSNERFDVLLLGSSVGAAVGHQGGDRLLEVLREDPRFANRSVRLFKYARASFKQPQQTMLFATLLSLGVKPDAVICIDGFNEVALALVNQKMGTHPLYPGIMQWGPMVPQHGLDLIAQDLLSDALAEYHAARDLGRLVIDNGLTNSCLLGRLTLVRIKQIHGRWLKAQDVYVSYITDDGRRLATAGPAFHGDRKAVVELAVQGWVRGTRMLHDLCSASSIPFVHMLQPNTNDPGSKPLSAEEQTYTASQEWVEAGGVGYPLLREACLRLAADGVHSVDASKIFAEHRETLYIDNAHLNPRGNKILAERAARALLEVLGDA